MKDTANGTSEDMCDYCHYVRTRGTQGTKACAQLPDTMRLCPSHAKVREVMIEAYIGYDLGLLSNEEYGSLIAYADALTLLIAMPRPGHRPAA